MDLLDTATLPVLLLAGYLLLTVVLLRMPIKDRD